MFIGPVGQLEGVYHQSTKRNAPLALVLHPHPLHGGSLKNRVTFTMARTFQDMGFSVLRYNSRGVGRSEGRYDGGIGEISDAAYALDWLQEINPHSSEIWIAGYSFGAFVGMQLLMRRPEVKGWISVAPPADDYDFGFLAPCPCGGLMIAGGRDQLAPEPSIRRLVEKLNTQRNVTVDYRVFDAADHIFSRQVRAISDAITDHVNTKQADFLPLEHD
ncbi:alpha/beta hydrolase [Formicincola oecophyllae]|uniref:Alpha/beta hydrolase n=2 Tax=Formicincola oecophyllae TaxID=2558361 RepID=A0A4Y6UBP8_9PROT|nr:alpha/beta hydrolase [Formicincola oecophyllae]